MQDFPFTPYAPKEGEGLSISGALTVCVKNLFFAY